MIPALNAPQCLPITLHPSPAVAGVVILRVAARFRSGSEKTMPAHDIRHRGMV